ncbi:MAG: protein-L-isoaspartate(D-aspartate) O-methyltransferase [Chloroflexota bacterium]
MRRWLGRRKHDEQPRDWAALQLEARGIRDPRVLNAMRAVPRERFVPMDLQRLAYEDGALPIGHGQTISQPYIVAVMTQALALPTGTPKVLDVGTGSGYQAAVLAQMGATVISIEREPALAETARNLLQELGYDVRVLVGDGSGGVPEEAPFDGIIVGAASPEVPVPLVEQLRPAGRLVIPIGSRSEQVITLVQRTDDGFTREPVEHAVFVPLLGEHGFAER